MDWCDVDDILFDGDRDKISELKCPDCGGHIKYTYYPVGKDLQVECSSCGYFARSHGGGIPNCYKFFGKQYMIA